MLAILPLLALLMLILSLRPSAEKVYPNAPWRTAILIGFTAWSTLIAIITESLSLTHALTRLTVACSWITACILLAVLICRQRVRILSRPCGEVKTLTCRDWVSLTGIAAILSLTLLIVLVAAPNNYDSLTYHLPRVMHWIQNRSVAFFPTPDARQICFPPWAEYHVLHYQILIGADRLAALPQWLAFAQAIIAASVLAGEFGAKRSTQLLAALITATIPMAILQSSSTQTDLIGGAWLLTAILFGHRLLRKPSWIVAAALGLATGLSLLTKTTMYLYAAPFLLILTAGLVLRYRLTALPYLVLSGVLALALNAPHYTRNMQLCGDPLGRKAQPQHFYGNETFGPRSFISNAARNAGLHLLTPSDTINGITERGIRFVHNTIGADIDEPATTFGGNRYQTKWLSTFEDDAPCPIHFLLTIFAIPAGCLLLRKSRYGPAYCILAGCLATGAALFCLILKWQPFHSRQHLSLFLCAAPLTAVALAQLPRARLWQTAITTLLLLTSLRFVLGNEVRPILFPMTPNRFYAQSIFMTDREDQYLMNRPLPVSWSKAVAEIDRRDCHKLGLLVEWFSCEYPLWLMLEELDNPPTVQHISVTNMPMSKSMQKQVQKFTPDLIIQFSDIGKFQLVPRPDTLNVNGQSYSLYWKMQEPGKPGAGARLYESDSPVEYRKLP